MKLSFQFAIQFAYNICSKGVGGRRSRPVGGRGSCSYLCAAHKRFNAADSERKAASCGQLQLPKKAGDRRERGRQRRRRRIEQAKQRKRIRRRRGAATRQNSEHKRCLQLN